MKPDKEKTVRKKLPPKGIVIAACLLGVCFLAYQVLQNASFSPWMLLVVAAIVSLALPMIRTQYFPNARDCAVEYDFHEKRLEEQIRRKIAGTLGQEALLRIDPNAAGPDDAAVQYIHSLLEKGGGRLDAELRFSLLVTLARYYEKSGDPHASIEHLVGALESNPRHFIANVRLAMNYEWIGATENALRHYRGALEDPGGISRGMKKLAAAQIKRLLAGEMRPHP